MYNVRGLAEGGHEFDRVDCYVQAKLALSTMVGILCVYYYQV